MHGLKDSYDFAFSMGAACACSMALRRAGMQYASFPLDWAGTVTLRGNVDMVVNDFKGMLTLENLEYVGPNGEKQKDIYHDRVNDMHFLHDFPMGIPPAESFPAIVEKYQRRIDRFLKLMDESHTVLAAYVEVPSSPAWPEEDILYAAERLNSRFPGANVDFFCFSQAKGVAFDPANVEVVGEHAFRVAFDFQSAKAENIADERVVASAYRAFVKNVRDYRTGEEKRKFRQVKRQKALDLYKASNTWELLRNKTYYKLMKHFQNRLEREGFVFG